MSAQKQPACVNCASWSTCQRHRRAILLHDHFFFSHYQQAFSSVAFICSSSRAVTVASGVTTAFPTLRRVPEQARLISKCVFGLICLAAVEAPFNSTREGQ